MNPKLEKNVNSLDENLSAFFNANLDDVSEQELSLAFPIQHDLKQDCSRYVDEEFLAQGGMKSIYRVRDLWTGRWVAKATLSKVANSAEIECFLREARLTSSLQHPNIIPIYDIGLDKSGQPFFIMELLMGETLGAIIKGLSSGNESYRKKYTSAVLIDVFSKICDAVAYAHSQHVVHLDIKPDNIHINDYGQVHLCDWGLSKIIDSDLEAEFTENAWPLDLDPDLLNTMTLNGELKGTPGFMAPEQLETKGKKDERTDVFSLGALLYSILDYKSPFGTGDLTELIDRTRRGDFFEFDMEPVESLAAISRKALNNESNQRYQDVRSLREDLNKYTQGFATSAENASFYKQMILLFKRNRLILGAALIFVLSFTVFFLISFKKIKVERELALEAETSALHQQAVAEETLRLYKNEQDLTQKQNRDLVQLLEELAQSNDLSKPRESLVVLSQALEWELEPKTKKQIHFKLAILHFILQEFNQAERFLRKAPSSREVRQLLKVCSEYGALKEEPEILSDAELAEVINYLSHTQRLIIPSLYFEHMRRRKPLERNPEQYWPLAKAMLMMSNNYWNTAPLERQLVPYKNGFSLDLSHTRYRMFRSRMGDSSLNVLQGLQLKKLNLSHTPFFEFWQIAGLKLEEINLSGCWVREIDLGNIKALQNMKLKKIIIDESLYSKESMDVLKESFEVIHQVQ
ncbi:serine/threonine-protein kinase [Lentisphaera marina]|uniref:serine/threonine protein kinase n=1 Tax=Lentisphaera marina TaxID=1111041 RepID=UPI0023672EE8|nr:serine/threonine-protein kinase [Lentisphaera marina]MDD7983712.1 serine/threonine-protein kinase [Lentisphaera marina]